MKFSFEVVTTQNSQILHFDPVKGTGAVSIGERQIALDAVRLSSNAYSLLIDGQSYDVSVVEINGSWQVLVNGKCFEVAVRDPKRNRKGSRAGEDSSGPQPVSAPMPGKVVKVLVQVGEEVLEGQGVAVVEAMKMQNELKSPKSGVVEKVLVDENQPVNAGENLLIVK